MMTITAAGPRATHHTSTATRRIKDGAAITTGTTLVAVEPIHRISMARIVRPEAAFVTHLIATATGDPQTRALRRAAPADADAVYRGRETVVIGSSGDVLRKTA